MDQTTVINSEIILPLLLQLFGLSFAICVDYHLDKRQRAFFGAVIVCSFSLVLQNYAEYLLEQTEPHIMLRTAIAVMGYSIRPVIIVLFCNIVEPHKKFMLCRILLAVNIVIHMSSFFLGVCFTITSDNHYLGGPLKDTCFFVSAAILLYLLFLTIRRFKSDEKRTMIIPLSIVVIVIGSVVMDSCVHYAYQPISYLTIAVVSCCVLYYIWLHLQFVKDHERDLRAQQRIELMMGQIKPHFLYNILGAIEELCDSDPKAAKEATVKFSRYLRGNMDTVLSEKVVSFENELSHVNLYLDLEKLRFEDALTVKYDITCINFQIPPLTIQTLVENAVRHGVRQNDNGRGCIIISTKEYSDHFEINVKDDGPGFDPNAPICDGRRHLGIKNVKTRLEKISQGTLEIKSTFGKGTTVTVVIPKDSGELLC